MIKQIIGNKFKYTNQKDKINEKQEIDNNFKKNKYFLQPDRKFYKKKHKNNPEYKEKYKEYSKQQYENIKNNPEEFKKKLENSNNSCKNKKLLGSKSMLDFIGEYRPENIREKCFEFFLNDFENKSIQFKILNKILTNANKNINLKKFNNKKVNDLNKESELGIEKDFIVNLSKKFRKNNNSKNIDTNIEAFDFEEFKTNIEKEEIAFLKTKFISYYNSNFEKIQEVKLEEKQEVKIEANSVDYNLVKI